ncbi:MAG: DUF4198 domain-containing protein [Planctomycetes bacterium]|nr:DUF4198 domain-containing protein [Planctomycetota bacterium]
MLHHMLSMIFLLMTTMSAFAHYHILIPSTNSPKSGEEIQITYKFEHPFEHQIFDCPEPASAILIGPDATRKDVKGLLKKIEIVGDKQKKVVAYSLTLKPEKRGDYTLAILSTPFKIEEEPRPVQDFTKTVIHVQAQKGWANSDRFDKQQVDLTPLTRPYGLRTGMLWRAALTEMRPSAKKPLGDHFPIERAEVELERYQSVPPKDLPPEEHITYTSLTDSVGVLAVSFPDSGWWAITAIRKSPDLVSRYTFWVLVDGPIPLKPVN